MASMLGSLVGPKDAAHTKKFYQDYGVADVVSNLRDEDYDYKSLLAAAQAGTVTNGLVQRKTTAAKQAQRDKAGGKRRPRLETGTDGEMFGPIVDGDAVDEADDAYLRLKKMEFQRNRTKKDVFAPEPAKPRRGKGKQRPSLGDAPKGKDGMFIKDVTSSAVAESAPAPADAPKSTVPTAGGQPRRHSAMDVLRSQQGRLAGGRLAGGVSALQRRGGREEGSA
ncbi:hypothetical protein M885DRAFT_511223 [Pelagophyceae sp. CCMP2097]|nr:hypothetical protein M885DRAFT_511223 [Pelagophyceae sp. CCMP2097]